MLQTSSHGAVTDSVRPPEFSRAERARVLAMTAAGSVVVSYAAVAALLALVSSTAAHARFSTTGVLTASAPGWLVAHHVPLRFDGGQLGVLPLLPTVLLMLLVSRAAAGAADRLGLFEPLQARGVVLSIAGAHAVVGGVIAFLMGDGGVVRATPAVAFFGCAAVSAVAAVAGVAQRCGLVEVVFERIDPVARRGLRAGALGLFALAAAGALVLACGLAVSWPVTSSLFDQAGGTLGTGLGIFLMCLAYLPNAVVGALSYVAGAGFSIGAVAVSPTAFTGGPVPAVPLLAALPETQSPLLPLVLVLPGAIGVLVGWSLRDAADTPRARLRAALVAAVTAAVGVLVLAAVAGGSLGGGVFDPVTVPAGLLAVIVFGWLAVPGGVVAWFAGPRPAPVPVEPVAEEPADTPEPDPDVEEEEFEDDEDDEAYEEELDELEEEFEEEEDDYDLSEDDEDLSEDFPDDEPDLSLSDEPDPSASDPSASDLSASGEPAPDSPGDASTGTGDSTPRDDEQDLADKRDQPPHRLS